MEEDMQSLLRVLRGHQRLRNRMATPELRSGLNLYSFVRNDGINGFDFLGLSLSGIIQDCTPLGGECCNKTKKVEWALVDGKWKKLNPGDCTGWFDDCDGMTCRGGFYAVYQRDGVCKDKKDTWGHRRWTGPKDTGGDKLPPGPPGIPGGDPPHRGSGQGNTPPGYTYRPKP